MPDREIAARLAGLRRSGVDLERRLRGDNLVAPDSESYWRGQIDAWRGEIEGQLTHYPFQLRALQAPVPLDDEPSWSHGALREIAEVRHRLDLTIERISDDA